MPALDRAEGAGRYVARGSGSKHCAPDWSAVIDVAGISLYMPPALRRILRAEQREARKRMVPERGAPDICNGHLVSRFDQHGAFCGRFWFGFRPGCGCPKCRKEYARRRVHEVNGHGGLTTALHFVCTTPPEVRAALSLEKLAHLRRCAVEAAREAVADVLGFDCPKDALAVIHPAGDAEPKTYAPHVDGFIAGEGIEAVAPRLDEFRAALRRRWRENLSRVCGISVAKLRLPQVDGRWYADEEAIRFALRDSLRSFPGWRLDTRLAFYGPWRRRPKAAVEEERPVVFVGGAIPIETLVAAGTLNALTYAESQFYAAREFERTTADEARARAIAYLPAPSARSSAAVDLDGNPVDLHDGLATIVDLQKVGTPAA